MFHCGERAMIISRHRVAKAWLVVMPRRQVILRVKSWADKGLGRFNRWMIEVNRRI